MSYRTEEFVCCWECWETVTKDDNRKDAISYRYCQSCTMYLYFTVQCSYSIGIVTLIYDTIKENHTDIVIFLVTINSHTSLPLPLL